MSESFKRAVLYSWGPTDVDINNFKSKLFLHPPYSENNYKNQHSNSKSK